MYLGPEDAVSHLSQVVPQYSVLILSCRVVASEWFKQLPDLRVCGPDGSEQYVTEACWCHDALNLLMSLGVNQVEPSQKVVSALTGIASEIEQLI